MNVYHYDEDGNRVAGMSEDRKKEERKQRRREDRVLRNQRPDIESPSYLLWRFRDKKYRWYGKNAGLLTILGILSELCVYILQSSR